MRTMLITGTTQGIGKCMYDRYKNNYHIITINRRYFEGNNIVCNLADINETVSVIPKIYELEIDILINNAGGAPPVVFPNMSAEELVACTNLNYHSPILLMQAVLEGMKQRNFGRVINISSIASKGPRPYIPHYGAAKSALEKFSSSMAVYYGNSGITVNCICPGGVETETSIANRKKMSLIAGSDENYFNNKMSNGNGLSRMVQPFEVVDMVDFLISDRATAVSGQVFNVCGVREVR
ncbi:MAG: SDR family oxidoreductase [Ruminococcus sp.]